MSRPGTVILIDEQGSKVTFWGDPVRYPDVIVTQQALLTLTKGEEEVPFVMDREKAEALIESLQKTFKL